MVTKCENEQVSYEMVVLDELALLVPNAEVPPRRAAAVAVVLDIAWRVP
jgi:hypothetical protein